MNWNSARAATIQLLVGGSGQGRARRALRIWPLWEALAHKLWPTVAIPNAKSRWVTLHFGPFKGIPIQLSDRTLVLPGDPVAEIHFDNRVLVEWLGDARGAQKIEAMVMFREQLHALAAWMSQPEFPYTCKAIFGVSVLASAGKRLGFIVRDRPPGIFSWFDSFFLSGLVLIYGSEGIDRVRLGRTLGRLPAEVWMSREELIRRYGPARDGLERSLLLSNPSPTTEVTMSGKESEGALSTKERNDLSGSEFAFPKERKEPINDASHVRNAIARFDQVEDVSDKERDEAWERILKAAKKYDVEVHEKSWHELMGKDKK